MKSRTVWWVVAVAVLSMLAMTSAKALAADEVKIVGKITDDYRIVDDNGQAYEIAENEPGNEVVEMIGKKVELMGVIEDIDGMKSIVVSSYKVLEE